MPQKIKVGELKTQNNKNNEGDLKMKQNKTDLLIEVPQLIRPTNSKKAKIIGINQYKDEKGNVLYEVVRQRRNS